MNNQILLTADMAYSNTQIIGRDSQGMIDSSGIGEEQGDLYIPVWYDIESNYEFDSSIHSLNRYPSTSMFDTLSQLIIFQWDYYCKDKALLKCFGVNNQAKNKDSNAHPEWEQLGIMINSNINDEMERLSLDLNIQTNPYWQKPDEIPPVKCEEQAEFHMEEHIEIDNDSFNNINIFDEEEVGLLSFEESKSEKDNFDDSNVGSREIRWRKDDDKLLFATYRTLWRKAMLNIKEVVSSPLKKNKQHKQIIQKVGETVGWKGKTSMLSKRIKKILMNHKLSVREKQDLTRLYKNQVKKWELDWEKILYEFPGKTLIFIKEFWKQIKVKIKPQISDQNRSNQKKNDKVSNIHKISKWSIKGSQCDIQLSIEPFKDWNIKDTFSSYRFEETILLK